MPLRTRMLLYGALLALVGALMAEFFPLFSDPLTQNVCQPYSPCRNSALPGYIIGGFILGIILGALSDLLRQRGAQPATRSDDPPAR